MKRHAFLVIMLALPLFSSTATAASYLINFKVSGKFDQRSAVLTAQQVFLNLAPDIVSKLDPTTGTRPYYFTFTTSQLNLFLQVKV